MKSCASQIIQVNISVNISDKLKKYIVEMWRSLVVESDRSINARRKDVSGNILVDNPEFYRQPPMMMNRFPM